MVALIHTRVVAQQLVATNFPHLLAAAATARVDQLLAEQVAKVEPAFAYFESKTIELKDQLEFYEAAEMFHPLLVKQNGLTEPELRRLVVRIPKLNTPATIDALVNQRAAYVHECNATPAGAWKECDVEALWHEQRFRLLGAWHAGGRIVMLAQPSSAPVERVFSMLQAVVGDQQGNALLTCKQDP